MYQNNFFHQKIVPLTLSLLLLIVVVTGIETILVNFDHNEHMYITAAYLYSQGLSLYRDFSYLQTPVLPIIYGEVFRLINGNYLLTGKLFSGFFYLASGLLVLLYCKRQTSWVVSLATTFLFCMNLPILRVSQESSNYIPAIFFTLLAFYLYTLPSASVGSWRKYFFLGLSLAIATGIKAYHIVLFLPFITLLFYDYGRPSLAEIARFRLLCASAGALVGGLPLLYYLIRDYSAFLFNNLGYHAANTQYRLQQDPGLTMTFAEKLEFFTRQMIFTGNAVLLIGIVISGLMICRRRLLGIDEAPGQEVSTHPIALALLLVLAALVTCFIPTPMFIQYLAMPLSIMVLLLITLLSKSFHQNPLATELLAILLVIVTAFCNWDYLDDMRDKQSKPEQIASVSRQLKQIYREHELTGKIATLSPLYAVESNLPIYIEFATGPFLYRVGHLIDPDRLQAMKGSSPDSLNRLLANDPPAMILVGYEKELDAALQNYAESHNYLIVDIPKQGTLFIRN